MTEGKNQNDNRENDSLTAILQIFYFCFGLIVLVGVLAIILYKLQFPGPFSDNQHIWGVFGDFFGGLLNPVIGFSALFALFITIIIQSKQLYLSRRELELTRIELQKSAEAAQNQLRHLETEAKRSELFKIIENISTDINTNLNAGIIRVNEEYYSISIVSLAHEDSPVYTKFKSAVIDGYARISSYIQIVFDYLAELKFYIERYQSLPGDGNDSHDLQNYYVRKYELIVEFLARHYEQSPQALVDYYRK